MIKKNPVKIVYSIHFLLILLMISCKVIAAIGAIEGQGLYVINKTDIELKVTGTFKSIAGGKCPEKIITSSFTAEKNGGTSYFVWNKERKDNRCLFSPYLKLKDISVYRSDNNDTIISASAHIGHGDQAAYGKLGMESPRNKIVKINGKKIKLTIDADCFKHQEFFCNLTIKQS